MLSVILHFLMNVFTVNENGKSKLQSRKLTHVSVLVERRRRVFTAVHEQMLTVDTCDIAPGVDC